MTYVEALKVVFPLLNGCDLASCMQVCKQWRDIAVDDYYWKCLCAKRWPSICKRFTPPPISFRELFQMFSKRYQRKVDSRPRFSFDDLDFYIDIWDKEKVVFSEVVPGSVLRGGIKDLPPNVCERHKSYINNPAYKMMIPVDPTFILLSKTVSASVLVCWRDTNKLACIFNKSKLCLTYEGNASNKLDFASIPQISVVLPWVYLFFMEDEDDDPVVEFVDVFGIALDFGDEADCEDEVLSLLQKLDWD